MALKIILSASIFFVWVVRYDNIIKEFNEYNMPCWFRDLVGICKLTFCGILLSNNNDLILYASGAMVTLMFAAFLTHIKFKHTIDKMLPSLSLLIICSILLVNS
ncbi:MAG: DoxX family protein [Candidatus Margulisbacteria bacterium]|nr:DoxX family protein [Candidatus Margulisiibacteriota bacterium]